MLEIPGYYYDHEKKKYFKIEKSSTAPSAATWSSDAVKRRKVEHRANEVVQRREWELRHHVKRHRLWDNTIISDSLRGELRDDPSWRGDNNLKATAWAGGLEVKGEVRFSRTERQVGHLPCLYVGGQEQGLQAAVVYSTLDEETLIGSYIPTDSNGKVSFQEDAPVDSPRRPALRTEMVRCPQMSSIAYHEGSHRMFLTSREPDHSCGLYFFSPPRSRGTAGAWLLGEAAHYQRLSIRHRVHDEWIVNNCRPAPPSLPNLICAIATNTGILRVESNESLTWITPHNPLQSGRGRDKTNANTSAPRDIFDLDFHLTNPNILFAAGRQPRLWLKDLRSPPADPCRYIHHESSIARLRAVSENHVLVCGLQNSMALYDIRFFPTSDRPQPESSHRPRRGPVLTFPEYRNSAHLQIGFDVSPELNIAAAAQDDGTVKLFSLSTGRRLACPPLDAGGKKNTPIKALMFQTVPGENSQSLFVGEGLWVKKYSFGTLELDG